MKTMMVCLTVALVPCLFPVAAQAQIVNCPPGTYLSIDQLGKPNCLQAGNHTPAIIQASPIVTCVSGTYPTVDDYGNRVCKSVDQRGPTYYGYPTNSGTPANSTPGSCPLGTFPAGIDVAGNQICRRM